MAGFQSIDIGTNPGDGTGDTPRVVGQKLNDMLAELFSPEDWTVVQDASLLNGWVNVSTGTYGDFSYRKWPQGWVDYRFVVDGSASTGDTIFTFPSGYRPQVFLPVVGTSTSTSKAVNNIRITPSGDVVWFGGDDKSRVAMAGGFWTD